MDLLIIILVIGFIIVVSYLRAIHISLQRIIEYMRKEND
ncbi:hypothetical protein PPOLYM_02564 [Paenibacillus polymyxa]|nr:hypothetical protein PPOLYM_02564 [Paenibacillus polymyxa]